MTLAPPLSQQVRETETWVPMKTTQTAAMLAQRNLEGSASDFGFTDDQDADSAYDDDDGDDLDYAGFSGSGDGGEDPPLPPFKQTNPVRIDTHASVSIATSVSTRGGFGPSAKVRNVCWRRPPSDRRSSDSCVCPAARGRRQRDS